MNKIHVLSNTYETCDGIRETDLLHASFDREYLRRKLREYVEKDDLGLFAKNGFEVNEVDWVRSEWSDYDGFDEYVITELEIEDGKPEVFKADNLDSILEV